MPPKDFRPEQGGETIKADSLKLLALPKSVRMARRLVHARLPEWGLEELIERCALVMSEFATNTVNETGPARAPEGQGALHAETPAVFVAGLRLTTTHLFVEVSDISHEPPALRSAGDRDENGRGLALVANQADHYSWYESELGKVVFAVWELTGVRASPHPVAVIA